MFLYKNTTKFIAVFIIILLIVLGQIFCYAEETPPAHAKAESRAPVLKLAVLCEGVEGSENPVNPAVVFSSSLGTLICFTDFDPVYEKTFVFHKYYFKDKLSSRIKLTLKPPSWRTQSSIVLRETDKGPWRVDITGADGKVLKTIRFSITD